MAEAGIAAFGAAAGVAIAMAVVLFALRGKGHPEPLEWDIRLSRAHVKIYTAVAVIHYAFLSNKMTTDSTFTVYFHIF